MNANSRTFEVNIGPKENLGWLAGESFSEYVGRVGTYSPKDGENVAIDPHRTLGTIRTGFASGLTVTGVNKMMKNLKQFTPRGRLMYGLDILSNLWVINMQANNASMFFSLNGSQSTNEDVGLEIHQDALYAAYNVNSSIARLAKMSALSDSNPTVNACFNTSLLAQSLNSFSNASASQQITHPLLSFKGFLFVFQANQILQTSGSTAILTPMAQLPANMIIKTVCRFGNVMAIGACDNLTDPEFRGAARVYLYDGISQSWQEEHEFPENDITCLATRGGELMGWGPKGCYDFNGSGFVLNRRLDATVQHDGTSMLGNRIFFKGSNVIRAYGKADADLDNAWTRPMTGAGSQGVVRWISDTVLYASANDGNLYRWSSSSNETSVRKVTRFFDAGDGSAFYIRAILVTCVALVSGGGISVGIIDDTNTNYDIGTLTFAADGALTSKLFLEGNYSSTPPNPMRKAKLYVTFDSGSVQVTGIHAKCETLKEI